MIIICCCFSGTPNVQYPCSGFKVKIYVQHPSIFIYTLQEAYWVCHFVYKTPTYIHIYSGSWFLCQTSYVRPSVYPSVESRIDHNLINKHLTLIILLYKHYMLQIQNESSYDIKIWKEKKLRKNKDVIPTTALHNWKLHP